MPYLAQKNTADCDPVVTLSRLNQFSVISLSLHFSDYQEGRKPASELLLPGKIAWLSPP
jgi:hypothetical protein